MRLDELDRGVLALAERYYISPRAPIIGTGERVPGNAPARVVHRPGRLLGAVGRGDSAQLRYRQGRGGSCPEPKWLFRSVKHGLQNIKPAITRMYGVFVEIRGAIRALEGATRGRNPGRQPLAPRPSWPLSCVREPSAAPTASASSGFQSGIMRQVS
jgi:hypothetical protein